MSDDWRFETVTGSSGERRDFRITLGLREGWKRTGRIYDIEEAVRAAQRNPEVAPFAGRPGYGFEAPVVGHRIKKLISMQKVV